MTRYNFSDLAIQQIREIDAWWRTHRSASDLFLDELDHALEGLLAAPESGHLDEESGVPGTRTIVLPRTNYLVYYRLVEVDEIRITSVWHASRGTRPNPDDLAREREEPYALSPAKEQGVLAALDSLRNGRVVSAEDELSEGDVRATMAYASELVAALAPLTKDEESAIAAGLADIRAGRTVSLEDALRRIDEKLGS